MAEQDYKFQGWLGLDAEAVEGHMVWRGFDPKPWEETDVDIKVTHSSICGTDVHMLQSGWGPVEYPICVGHETVGFAVRVGSQAEGGIKVGDRVGVGSQSDACLGRQGECEECAAGLESYCSKLVLTYAARHYNGGKAMGGHAKYQRVPSHFVVKIPDGLPSAYAAPMLCGGLTLYSPLRYHQCGPGKKVGIIGVGGLGHFGVLFARALGADRVLGISRSASKRDDALSIGADEYIATGDDPDWSKKHDKSLDLIISTLPSSKIPLQEFLSLLRTDGTYVQVGNPDDGSYTFHPRHLISRRIKFTGSCAGSPKEMREMLQLAADRGVKPWVQVRPMAEANQAIVDMGRGKARYRYVLKN